MEGVVGSLPLRGRAGQWPSVGKIWQFKLLKIMAIDRAVRAHARMIILGSVGKSLDWSGKGDILALVREEC